MSTLVSRMSAARMARTPPTIGAIGASGSSQSRMGRCSTVFSRYVMGTVGPAGARADVDQVVGLNRLSARRADSRGRFPICGNTVAAGNRG